VSLRLTIYANLPNSLLLTLGFSLRNPVRAKSTRFAFTCHSSLKTESDIKRNFHLRYAQVLHGSLEILLDYEPIPLRFGLLDKL
jgi:hypothetical protein